MKSRRAAGALSVALALTAILPGQVFGYDRTAAVAWAESHWNSCGVSGQYPCIDNDCTNYASQVIHEGGFDFRGYPGGNLADPNNWYAAFPSGHYVWTNTWSFAENFYGFLLSAAPGGSLSATYQGTSVPSNTPGVNGDLIFYDWNPNVPDGGSEPRDHVNPIVANGTSSDVNAQGFRWVGDLVNGHSNYRWHYFWALLSVNQNKLTTKFYVVHISDNA